MHTNQLEEHIFMCKPLLVHIMGEDISKLIDSYTIDKGLSWKDCVKVCTDWAQSMMEKTRGFIVYVKAIGLRVY
jgi:hypothetical protein